MQSSNLSANYSVFTQMAIKTYSENMNKEYGLLMSAYMKGNFPYLGIKSPQRKEINTNLLQKKKLPALKNLSNVVWELWLLPEREYHYLAIELLNKFASKQNEEFITEYELLIQTKSWWDSIDSIAPKSLAVHFERFPHLIPVYISKWLKSENIWLQRSAILFQLKAKKNTDLILLYSIISELKTSREFFVQKAIGWILREYSKVDENEVIRFVSTANLKPLSKREALKRINAKKGANEIE